MEEKLQELHETQVEILNVFDAICRENHLNYSLYAGTLLGAVRHQGFIPWDDDLDVCMPREDYDRFLAAWEKQAPTGYLLQNKENSPSFTQSFSKIRKRNTIFLLPDDKLGQYHTGIFIDIFPIDRIPAGFFAQKRFLWNCMRYQLLTREHPPTEGNPVVRLASQLILQCSPKKNREKKRNSLLRKITAFDKNRDLRTVGIENMYAVRHPFTSTMLDSYVELPFERKTYQCFAEWDSHLKTEYGDYMQLPPVEERVWKHHPRELAFDRELPCHEGGK